MPRSILFPLSCLALPICIALAQAASIPNKISFTISPATTIVTGPLNPDGTINYIQVINDRLSQGVTSENNAAIPFIQATTNAANLPLTTSTAEFLHVPVNASDALVWLNAFVSQKQASPLSDAETSALENEAKVCKSAPWKTAEHPVVADWLAHSEKAFALLDAACKRNHCFLPWISKSSPPVWSDALPSLAMFRIAEEALLMKSMLNAGEGRLPDTLADLKRIRIFARFCVRQGTDISLLVSVAMETAACRAYESLAVSNTLTAADIKTIRQEISALPPLPTLSDASDIEQFIGLDYAMTCFRGDYQRVLHNVAGIMDESVTINPGDLPRLDGNEFLKAIQNENNESKKRSSLPFDQQMKVMSAIVVDPLSQQNPNFLWGATIQPKDLKTIENYLLIRSGESRADFSKRIAHWWFAGSPDLEQRMYKAVARGALERDIALLTISLAEYHLSHGQYPATLTPLGIPVLQDPFSGSNFIYRQQGEGFILYSFGPNQKDDNGAGDDLPVTASK